MKQQINKGDYIKTFDGKLHKVAEDSSTNNECVYVEVNADSKHGGEVIPMSQVYIVNIPEECTGLADHSQVGDVLDTANAKKAAFLEEQVNSQKSNLTQTKEALRKLKDDKKRALRKIKDNKKRLEKLLEYEETLYNVSAQSYKNFVESIK